MHGHVQKRDSFNAKKFCETGCIFGCKETFPAIAQWCLFKSLLVNLTAVVITVDIPAHVLYWVQSNPTEKKKLSKKKNP